MLNPFRTYIYDKKNKVEIKSKDINMNTDKEDLQILLAHKDEITQKEFVIGDVYYNNNNEEFYIFSLFKEHAINYKTNKFGDDAINGFGFMICQDERIQLHNKKDFLTHYKLELKTNTQYIGNLFKEDLVYVDENEINKLHLITLEINNLNEMILFKLNGQQYTIILKSLKLFAGDALVLKKIINEPFTFDIVVKFKSIKGEILKTAEYNGSLFRLLDLESDDFLDDDIEFGLRTDEIDKIRKFYKEIFVFLTNDGIVSYLSTSSIKNNTKIKGYPIMSYSKLMRSYYKVSDYVRNNNKAYLNSLLLSL